MTLFEYLTIGYSLIVSFAVLRALSGFPHILRAPARYWVHVFWVVFALLGCLVVFWAFWRFREAEWTIFRYILLLAIPSLLNVQNSILVPTDPASVTSWRRYFFEMRRPLFATGVVLHSTTLTANYVLLEVKPLDPATWPVFGLVGLCVVGFSSGNPRLHAVLVLVLTAVAAAILSIATLPDF